MPKMLLLGSINFRKAFKFNFYFFYVNLKTFLSFKISFEYLSEAPVMDTNNTTAIALAMDNITSNYVDGTPDGGEGKLLII